MPSKNDDGGWKKFMWNSETGELLGRTGGSWCEYDCGPNRVNALAACASCLLTPV